VKDDDNLDDIGAATRLPLRYGEGFAYSVRASWGARCGFVVWSYAARWFNGINGGHPILGYWHYLTQSRLGWKSPTRNLP